MVSAEDVVEAFEDLGYTLDDPKLIDLLCSFCDLYEVDENKISCEFLAYAKKKKLQAPTTENIEQFDNDVLKNLKSSIKENLKRSVLDSTNVRSWTEDQEDDVLECYGTPKSSSKSKRTITPDSGINKRRFGASLGNDSNASATFQTPPSGKYTARDNAGKVLIRHGDPKSASHWSNTSDIYRPEIKLKDPSKTFPRDYKFMFERLREKAGFLDETICRLGDALAKQLSLEEPIGFGPPMNEPFASLGRICCDSEGRLNANSLLLQGTQDLSRGHALPFDVSQLKEYSVFPGQVVHTTITNPCGSRLIAHSLSNDATPSLAPISTKLRVDDTLQVVVACGPYTTSDNLSYEPLSVSFLRITASLKIIVISHAGPFELYWQEPTTCRHLVWTDCRRKAPTDRSMCNQRGDI